MSANKLYIILHNLKIKKLSSIYIAIAYIANHNIKKAEKDKVTYFALINEYKMIPNFQFLKILTGG